MKCKKRIITFIMIGTILTGNIAQIMFINNDIKVSALETINTKQQATELKQLSVGDNYFVFLKTDGTVWAWGANTYGQLGVGDSTAKTKPAKVLIDNVKKVITGIGYHTMFLKNDGTVWATGYNNYGQLGIGDNYDRIKPFQVEIDNVKDVIMGKCNTMFIKNDNTVWATGYNYFGQLGTGDKVSPNTPVQVPVNNVKDIIVSGYHTMFIKNDNTVWATGRNNNNEINSSTTTGFYTPVKILQLVDNISAGEYYTVYIKDNLAYSIGYNYSGQLGVGHNNNVSSYRKINITNIKRVIAGIQTTFLIKDDGTVYATGYNSQGQLGVGHMLNQNIPTKVLIDNIDEVFSNKSTTIYKKKDGTIWLSGYNYLTGKNEPTPVKLSDFVFENPNIDESTNLVEKAEQSKIQSDLDLALIKINELEDGQIKTDLLDRLNNLQIEINNTIKLQEAKDAVLKAESSKLQEDVNKAKELVNSLPQNQDKTDLLNKLDIVQQEINNSNKSNNGYEDRLQHTKDKVAKAELSKSQTDILIAQTLIDKLNPEDQNPLQEKIDIIKEAIKLEQEIINYNKLLEDATQKVIKAEETKADYNITVAQTAVNKLKPNDKEPLQLRLDILNFNILLEIANLKVDKAETIITESAIDLAQKAIDKVPNDVPIQEGNILSVLVELIDNINPFTPELLNKVQLQEKLDLLKQSIENEKIEQQKIETAKLKVKQAYASKKQTDIESAKLAIAELKTSELKTELAKQISDLENSLAQINIENLIYVATVHVKQAEALKRETYITKAQASIDKIPDCDDKTVLQNRLNSINK